jgi:shikimate dehydrogenase
LAICKTKACCEKALRKFGLIGFPLTHSFSKKYFDQKFEHELIRDCSYELFVLQSIAGLPSLISNPAIRGLNVTIPYKESVIPFLHEIDELAKEVGAVNCIKMDNGNLKGYNTDVYGFQESLKVFLSTKPQQTFVLGTGGSSKAVCFALQLLNLSFIRVSRQKSSSTIAYKELAGFMKESNLFINTTPLGMFPNVNDMPQIPFERLSKNDLLFDLVYNPEESLFLKTGREKGAKTKNGLEMLGLQAEKSWEIWNSE